MVSLTGGWFPLLMDGFLNWWMVALLVDGFPTGLLEPLWLMSPFLVDGPLLVDTSPTGWTGPLLVGHYFFRGNGLQME